MKRQRPARAEKGSIDTTLNLRLSKELRTQIVRAAREHDPRLSASEWIRRACEKELGR